MKPALGAAFSAPLQPWLPGASILWERLSFTKPRGTGKVVPEEPLLQALEGTELRRNSGSPGCSQVRARGVQKGLVLLVARTGGAGVQQLSQARGSHRLQALLSPGGFLCLIHVGRAMLCWEEKPHVLCPPRSPSTLRWCSGHSWGMFWLCNPVQLGGPGLSWLQHPCPGAAAGMHGEGCAFLGSRREGGWMWDGLCRATVPPPSFPGEGRGAGARTMGCGADSNSQFLVASSPCWSWRQRGRGKLSAPGQVRGRSSWVAGVRGFPRHSQPWPRWSGSWHPGTAQVRQQQGRAGSGSGAGGSAGTAHPAGQDPGLGAPVGHRASGGRATAPGSVLSSTAAFVLLFPD